MGDERVKEQALRIIGMFQALPRLVVFDLDYTLWPFYCECRSKREMPSLYPHAKGILSALKDKRIDVAIASRSPTPDIAKTFLDKLGIQTIFVAQEIFSSWTHKTEHFQRIYQRTGVPFKSMLFFDDEDRNIGALLHHDVIREAPGDLRDYKDHNQALIDINVSKMGVTSILVDNGVNLEKLRLGLEEFASNANQEEN